MPKLFDSRPTHTLDLGSWADIEFFKDGSMRPLRNLRCYKLWAQVGQPGSRESRTPAKLCKRIATLDEASLGR